MLNKSAISCASRQGAAQKATLWWCSSGSCRDEQEARWIVLVEDQFYGEYLGRDQAILDAIEAVKDARAIGGEAEVWDKAKTLRLY